MGSGSRPYSWMRSSSSTSSSESSPGPHTAHHLPPSPPVPRMLARNQLGGLSSYPVSPSAPAQGWSTQAGAPRCLSPTPAACISLTAEQALTPGQACATHFLGDGDSVALQYCNNGTRALCGRLYRLPHHAYTALGAQLTVTDGHQVREVLTVPVSLLSILVRARRNSVRHGELVSVLDAPPHNLNKCLNHPPTVWG